MCRIAPVRIAKEGKFTDAVQITTPFIQRLSDYRSAAFLSVKTRIFFYLFCSIMLFIGSSFDYKLQTGSFPVKSGELESLRVGHQEESTNKTY